MTKFGETGSEVAEVQKLLSLLGYDLIVDGVFGKKTLRSIRSFQKKYNLTQDGIVGNKTLMALKLAQKKSTKPIHSSILKIDYQNLMVNTNYSLPSSQFIKQITDKKQIFIHFTAGNPSAKNTIRYWGSNESKVATAFVIDGDTGEIFQAFHPDYWGWHLGIKGTKGKLDKQSIGIEICAFGPLKKKNDKYYAWPSNWNKEIPEKEVYKLEKKFRGYNYFHAYTEKQLESLEKLLRFLINKYNITVQANFDETWFDYKPELIKNATPGIWTHVNVRKDKTDSYPDKRLLKILNNLK